MIGFELQKNQNQNHYVIMGGFGTYQLCSIPKKYLKKILIQT